MAQRVGTFQFPGGVVVLDNGTGYLRVGYAGEEAPRLCIPNMAAKKIEAGAKPLVGRAAADAYQYFSLYPHKRSLLLDPELQLSIWKGTWLNPGVDNTTPQTMDPNRVWKPSAKEAEKQCLYLLITPNPPVDIVADYLTMVFEGTNFGGVLLQEQPTQVPYVYRCMAPTEPIYGPSLIFPPVPRDPQVNTNPKGTTLHSMNWVTSLYQSSPFLRYRLTYSEDPKFQPTVHPPPYYKTTAMDPSQYNREVAFNDVDPVSTLPYERNPWALPENCNRATLIVDLGHQSIHITPLLHKQTPSTPKKVIKAGIRRCGLGGILLASNMARGVALRSAVDPGNNSLLHRSLLETSTLCASTPEGFVHILREAKKKMALSSGKSFVNPADPTAPKRLARDPYHLAVPLPIYRKRGGRDPLGPQLHCFQDTRVYPLGAKQMTEEQKAFAKSLQKSEAEDNIELGAIDRFSAAECLFRPSMLPIEFINESYGVKEGNGDFLAFGLPSLVETIASSILTCPEEIQADLSSQIMLSGGLASIPGLRDRLLHDLRPYLPQHYPIGIYSPEDITDAGNLPWMGASCRAAAYPEAVDSSAVTRKMYNEIGATRLAHWVIQNMEAVAGVDQVLIRPS